MRGLIGLGSLKRGLLRLNRILKPIDPLRHVGSGLLE